MLKSKNKPQAYNAAIDWFVIALKSKHIYGYCVIFEIILLTPSVLPSYFTIEVPAYLRMRFELLLYMYFDSGKAIWNVLIANVLISVIQILFIIITPNEYLISSYSVPVVW